jgi:acyl transferase domain-containing protein
VKEPTNVNDTVPQDRLSPLKRAYLKLEELQTRVEAFERAKNEPIAIIGIGCRFPGGASDPDAFLRVLRDGVDAVSEIPAGRWDVDAYFDPRPGVPGRMYTRAGAFLADVDRFDPHVFGIAPREAVMIDPQQRLLLEVAWEALERAGYAPDRLGGSATGVFIGICRSDYGQALIKLNDPTLIDAYFGSGGAHSVAAGRLSYIFGFRGPSLAIDTACSSSLVALHVAVQSLRRGESRMALVGGVNVILSPECTINFCQSSMLALDGRCKTFDGAADGFAQGEGCGVVVLKRLSDAIADGDRIDAVIRATAVNQDGASSGLTAPNGPSQEALLRDALTSAGLEPEAVGYVEAHGTGTSLGDPIEVQALGAVLGNGRSLDQPLVIGSVKTNLGHLEAASGVAGLIKAVLAVRHGQIFPHLHFKTPNPHIAWDAFPLRVATRLEPWIANGRKRIAGVSAFGFSGTNAHVLVEEPPASIERPTSDGTDPLELFVLSAANLDAARDLSGKYRDTLSRSEVGPLADVCFTASAGRVHFPHRMAMVAESIERLCDGLSSFAEGGADPRVKSGHAEPAVRPKIAFLYTGQGAQSIGMGHALYQREPVFRNAFDACDNLLRQYLPTRLSALLYENQDANQAEQVLRQTLYAQPALFAVEYALTSLWASWGIKPSLVMGHSIGEYAAACVAGLFTLEDAVALVAERGRLMQSLGGEGRMAAVFADERTVAAAIGPEGRLVSIAAINGPENTVLAGDGRALETVLARLTSQGLGSKFLNVSHAFHSPLMDPILDEFARIAGRVSYSAGRLGIVSNATGRLAGAGEMTRPGYWRDHIRKPVRFADSIHTLHALGCDVFLEVGPGAVLTAMGAKISSDRNPAWLPTLRQGRTDREQMLSSLAELYLLGCEIGWDGVHDATRRRRVSLPTYPFQRERYWCESLSRPSRPTLSTENASLSGPPFPGRRLNLSLDETVFETQLNPDCAPFLTDHVVHGVTVLPTTAYVAAALEAWQARDGSGLPTLDDLIIHSALPLSPDAPTIVQTVLSPLTAARSTFRISSRRLTTGREPWTLHAAGTLVTSFTADSRSSDDLEQIRGRCREAVDVKRLYERLWDRGLQFGPSLHTVQQLWRGDNEAVGIVELPDPVPTDARSYIAHPALLDGCLQVLAAAAPGFSLDDRVSDVYMPLGLDRLELNGPLPERVTSHAWIDSSIGSLGESITAHVRIYDADGAVLGSVRALRMKRVSAQLLARTFGADIDASLYQVKWRADSLPTPSQLRAILGPRLAQYAEHFGVSAYDELRGDLDRLAVAHILEALRALGWDMKIGECVDPDRLAADLRVTVRHRRVFDRFLSILSEHGILRKEHRGWSVRQVPQQTNAAQPGVELNSARTVDSAEITLMNNCGPRLADVLRGSADPLQLLFPGGGLGAATAVYTDTPLARTFGTLNRDLLKAVLAQLPSDRRVRILEVGAGTGSATVFLLPELPADRAEYVLTDIGNSFVVNARRRFDDFPFLRAQVLDIEQDPRGQGFEPGYFDIVIASNVLHATADLRTTLAHIRSVLAPGGLLVILEGVRPQLWFDVTFGLTDGWWRFTDRELRPAYPLMGYAEWIRLLGETGFADAVALPEGGTGAVGDHALILARTLHTQSGVRTDLSRARGTWIVFTDDGGIGERLALALEDAGDRAVRVTRGPVFRRDAGDRYTIALGDAGAVERVLDEAKGELCHGIVHLWALDGGRLTTAESEMTTALELGCESVLHLVQAALKSSPSSPPRLWVATRGAQPVDGRGVLAPGHATIWGLGRSVALEHPELHCVRVDLDPDPADGAVEALLDVLRESTEDQVAYRGGVRYVPRLLHTGTAASAEDEHKAVSAVQLVVGTPPSIEGLQVRPVDRRAPGPGEIEIDVRATGLNFRDVLNAIGMRSDADPIGSECSGVVVRCGEGVEEWACGDEVVAITMGAFANFVTTDTTLVVRKPARLSFEQAASVPLAFLTASYALHEIARIAPGERVLIHAAAGGVGLAAVRLAQQAGAVIFATAGSPEKRKFLEESGVPRVLNSRSVAFADDVMAATGGEGIDIVLNSLTGESIAKSLSLLRAGGRFVEIGKAEIWTAERVAAVNPRATYCTVDLSEKLHQRPEDIRPSFTALMSHFADGTLEPLPLRVFPLEQAPRAFEHMARARHIGKVVLAPTSQMDSIRRAPALRPTVLPLRSDATYLITGGVAGLGLEVARWMVARGARHLALVGRRAPGAEARSVIDQLTAAGAEVMTRQCDVSQLADVQSLTAAIARGMPPLRGVIHSAGVLDDGVVLQQTWDRFQTVMAPKVRGAINLHAATEHSDLDFFVLFSSISGLLGSPAQGNHAAANAFMDAMAYSRQALGLPALSINWGVWTDVGAAARHGVGGRIGGQGLIPFTPQFGIRALERLLEQPHPQVAVMPMDWQRFFDASPWARSSHFFSEVAIPTRQRATRSEDHPTVNAVRQAPAEGSLGSQLAAAAPAKRRGILTAYVQRLAQHVLGLNASRLPDRRVPLSDIGLDSLMAVELRNSLAGAVRRPLPATLLFDYPTIDALVDYLATPDLGFEAAVPAPAPSADQDDSLSRVENLSDEEVDRLLSRTTGTTNQ